MSHKARIDRALARTALCTCARISHGGINGHRVPTGSRERVTGLRRRYHLLETEETVALRSDIVCLVVVFLFSASAVSRHLHTVYTGIHMCASRALLRASPTRATRTDKARSSGLIMLIRLVRCADRPPRSFLSSCFSDCTESRKTRCFLTR